MIINLGEVVMSNSSRKKLSPEESIAKAEAALERAKQKAADEANRAKIKAQRKAREEYWAKRREAINFADDIVERVEQEVVAKHIPTVPAPDDDDDYDYRSPEHVAHELALHHAKGLDDDGFDPDGNADNPLSEKLELEAFASAAATFEKLYRKALEDGIKAELSRPKAERDYEVQAYLDRRLQEDCKREQREAEYAAEQARDKAEWLAEHPGETHWSDKQHEDENEDA
jgi:hypothetical protein